MCSQALALKSNQSSVLDQHAVTRIIHANGLPLAVLGEREGWGKCAKMYLKKIKEESGVIAAPGCVLGVNHLLHLWLISAPHFCTASNSDVLEKAKYRHA